MCAARPPAAVCALSPPQSDTSLSAMWSVTRPVSRTTHRRCPPCGERLSRISTRRMCGCTTPGHTCATLMHLQGVPIALVAAWLGHADVSFTLWTYVHAQPEALDSRRAALHRPTSSAETDPFAHSCGDINPFLVTICDNLRCRRTFVQSANLPRRPSVRERN